VCDTHVFLLPGTSLLTSSPPYFLQLGKFHERQARITASHIALGLEHLRKLGIVHRDIKPDNVLFAPDGVAVLTGAYSINLPNTVRYTLSHHASRRADFGLARYVGTGDKQKKLSNRAGTPGYWAPQCLRGEPYSCEADWWSFGCLIFRMVSGINPFHTDLTGSAFYFVWSARVAMLVVVDARVRRRRTQ
jgi:serine/threonine protein kinase